MITIMIDSQFLHGRSNEPISFRDNLALTLVLSGGLNFFVNIGCSLESNLMSMTARLGFGGIKRCTGRGGRGGATEWSRLGR